MGPPSASPRRGQGSSSAPSRKAKVSSGICCNLSLNSLWSVWYCSLAVALQLYIVARSIKRFGQYIALPWPVDDQPYLELNAYVGFLGAAVVLMPFFIATAVLRIGNFPNDGRKVSSIEITPKSGDHAVYQNVRTTGKQVRWTRSLWRHLGPTAAFLHVASAFCLLLPKVFIQAQLVRHGFLRKSEIWASEMDFIATHKDRLVSFSFLSTVNESELWSQEVSRTEHFSGISAQPQLEQSSVAVSAEFINFGVSLLVYAIRYPSVFWDSSKSFGFLFSFQLLLNGFQQLLSFSGFGILYNVHVYGPALALVRFTPLMLDLSTTVLLFFVYNMAMTATSCTLYAYGLQKHREWMERQFHRHHITWGKERWRLWGYTPHVSAFVVLVILAGAAAPIAYDLTLVYCGSLDGAALAALTSTVSHLFLWIILWLFLTIKQRWVFQGNSRKGRKSLKLRDGARVSTCNGHIPRETVDADLAKLRESRGDAPLLVVDSGQTYQIREKSCRKAILSLANQSLSRQKNSSSTDDEDIYWLKPRPPPPKAMDESMDDEEEKSSAWMRSQKRSPPVPKPHKVTFEEALLNSCPTRRKSSMKSPKYAATKSKKSNLKIEDFSETGSEDGDYATLSNLPATDDRGENQALMSLCPLGEDRMASLERHDRLVRPIPPPPMSIAEIGSESTKSIDSGTESMSRKHPPKLPDSGSISSNSPEKGQGSDTSSGVHSGGGSFLGGRGDKRASSSLENVSLEASTSWKSPSHQTESPASSADVTEPASYDSQEPTVMIWRKHRVMNSEGHGKEDHTFGRATNIRLTTFSEVPACNDGAGLDELMETSCLSKFNVAIEEFDI